MKQYCLFSIFMIIFTSCASKKLIEYPDMKLTISTTDEIVSDSVNITVSFENNSADDIYLFKSDARDILAGHKVLP